MRMKGNDIAACLMIALGVERCAAALLSASRSRPCPLRNRSRWRLLVPLPHRSSPPSRSLAVETVRFSATGDDLIHDGIFCRPKRGGDHYDFSFAYENMRDFYTQFDVNWLNQKRWSMTLSPQRLPDVFHPR